jgi:hypothetical protein
LAILATVISASATAYSTDYYTGSSLFGTGKWVKIRVKDNGIYQITYDSLREMGFSDPAKVAVYGFGGSRLTDNLFDSTLADDIHQTATYHTADGRILFYGEGDFSYRLKSVQSITLMRNVYDNYGYYFLSDCQTPAEISTIKWQSRKSISEINYGVEVIENEVQNPGKGGSIFHDKILEAGESEDFEFDLKDTRTAQNGYIIGKAAVLANKVTVLDATCSGDIEMSKSLSFSISAASSSSKFYRSQTSTQAFNTTAENAHLTVNIGVRKSSDVSYAAVDYVGVVYPRNSRLGDDTSVTMQFPSISNKNFSIADAESNTIVWNIDDPANVYGYEVSYSADSHTVECSIDKTYNDTSGACRVIAFNPAATFATPTVIGDVANQNIHADAVPDMVIITTEALYDKAEALAEIHRSLQGLTVNVYTQQQVYNEFSSGCRAAMAYRRMAKMFYDRDSSKFQNLLLYGASHWDNRAITVPDRDLLVCYEVELESLANDENTNFVSDNYFGMLDDVYNPENVQHQNVNIAVGRIATDNPYRAENFNQKVLEYISNLPSPKAIANAVFSSDDGNGLSHLIQAEEAIATMADANPTLTFTKAHNTLYEWESLDAKIARDLIINGLKAGAGYFSYSGHGNSTSITSENIWSNTYIASVDYSVPTYVMLASCHTFAFDTMDNGMGELYLAKRNGGAIAVIGSSRDVYLDYNQQLNLAIAKAYAEIDENSTVGSIYLNAHKALLASDAENGAMVNTLCYNLGGDPAVPIIGPKYGVQVTAIDGKQVNADDSTSITVKPHNEIKIEGCVTEKGSDKVCSDFSGDVLINIYDAPRTLTTLLRSSGDGTTPMDIELNSDLLAMATAKVSNGKFVATLYLPSPANFDLTNRMTLFATSDEDSKIYGAGECTAMSVSNDSDEELASTSAPQIIDAYINDESFVDNDCVDSYFTYRAVIDPSEVGLNLSQTAIGTGSRLMLDGSKAYANVGAYIKLRDDGLAEMAVPFSDVALGRHILTLYVANTFGERAERSIEFNVTKQNASAEIEIAEPVARQTATIDIKHTFNSTPDCNLIIQADNGTTVVNRSNCSFPYSWNLQDKDGKAVADGHYRAYILLNDGNTFTSTPAADIIVIRE